MHFALVHRVMFLFFVYHYVRSKGAPVTITVDGTVRSILSCAHGASFSNACASHQFLIILSCSIVSVILFIAFTIATIKMILKCNINNRDQWGRRLWCCRCVRVRCIRARKNSSWSPFGLSQFVCLHFIHFIFIVLQSNRVRRTQPAMILDFFFKHFLIWYGLAWANDFHYSIFAHCQLSAHPSINRTRSDSNFDCIQLKQVRRSIWVAEWADTDNNRHRQ